MSTANTPGAGTSDIYSMSDEDILNMSAPPVVTDTPPEPVVQTPPEPEPAPAAPADPPAEVNDDPPSEIPASTTEGEDPATKVEDPPSKVEEKSDIIPTKVEEGQDKPTDPPATVEGDPSKQKEPSEKEAASSPGSKQDPKDNPPDFEALYKGLMAPLKANGKTIELRDPKELIQLAQQGANYTHKMQQLAPHRKVLVMLQNNDLLDEGSLSFLIDLKNKNPEAIKKLIKDSGIDPMDLDMTVEPAYREGNHRVSDKDVEFSTALETLKGDKDGQETLQIIVSSWDQASKEALGESPELMQIMHDQRMSGIYDRITSELNRQKILGTIPANEPFLQAYKTVGDQLVAAGAFNDLKPAAPVAAPPAQKPVPVATTVAAPKATVANGDKASAASPTRSSPKPAKEQINPLAMSDEEFMKAMSTRL